jgi:hypothetical protein
MAEYPPCPVCAAETIVRGKAPNQWLETEHLHGCAWMLDPESDPYDEFPDE